MSRNVECPYCEAKLKLPPGKQPTQCKCPECDHAFDLSKVVAPDSAATDSLQPDEPAAPTESHAVPKPNSTDHRPALTDRPAAETKPGGKDGTDPVPAAGTTVEVSQKRTIPRKKQIIPPWLTILFFLAVAVGLVFALVHVINNPPTVVDSLVANPEPVTVGPIPGSNRRNPNSAARDADPQGAEPTPAETPPPPPPPIVVDLIDPNPRTWSRKSLREWWKNSHAKMLKLTAHTAAGEQHAIGTLVDTRGWIVTSLRSVAGASSIDVQQFPHSRQPGEQTDLLKDQVRGVIAVDRQHDLVLLAVNRRFVVSLSEIQLEPEDQIVGSQYLAHCFFPSANSPVAVRESRVQVRARIHELDTDLATAATHAKLDNPSVNWVVHQPPLADYPDPVIAGTPLFSSAGQLVAVNTGTGSGKNHLAVPAGAVVELISNANAEIQSLAVINDQLTEAGVETIAAVDIVKDHHPLRRASEEMNRLGQECDSFGWQMESAANYQKIQAFVSKIIEIKTYLYLNPEDPEAEKFERQFQFHFDQLSQNLLTDPDWNEPQVSSVNQNALNSIRKKNGQVLLLFGSVAMTALDSPQIQQQDTITIQVHGSERYVTAIYDPEGERAPQLRPDSRWFFILTAPAYPEIAVRVGREPETKNSLQSQLIYMEGPFK